MTTILENITQAPGDDKVAQFEERFTRALNEGGVLLMSSVGHRLGLFNVMHGIPPLTR